MNLLMKMYKKILVFPYKIFTFLYIKQKKYKKITHYKYNTFGK